MAGVRPRITWNRRRSCGSTGSGECPLPCWPTRYRLWPRSLVIGHYAPALLPQGLASRSSRRERSPTDCAPEHPAAVPVSKAYASSNTRQLRRMLTPTRSAGFPRRRLKAFSHHIPNLTYQRSLGYESAKTMFRACERLLEERSVRGVAAHDTVESDDGCGRQVARDSEKITVDELRGGGPLSARGLLGRRGKIRR
jgi:hypothetical protein